MNIIPVDIMGNCIHCGLHVQSSGGCVCQNFIVTTIQTTQLVSNGEISVPINVESTHYQVSN